MKQREANIPPASKVRLSETLQRLVQLYGETNRPDQAVVSSCRPSFPRYSGRVSDVTRILEAVQQGDPAAAKDLLPLVYEELRRLARSKMAQQAGGHTLQPTALVHEAWLRLVGSERQGWNGRSHFFAAAAEAMRHILVDSARRKRRAKHGGGQERLDVDEIEIAANAGDDKILLVHEALEKLAMEDPIRAEVVKLHYFVGLTHAESAEILQISEKTVRRHWNFARVWLFQTIQSADQPSSPLG